MSSTDPLLSVDEIATGIEVYLTEIGQIFKEFKLQDSGCISYGVENTWGRKFVKFSEQAQGIKSLKQAKEFHSKISHPILPQILNSFTTPSGFAIVYEWIEAEILYDYTLISSDERINSTTAPHYRFRTLPLTKILNVLNEIYEFHEQVEAAGYVAVDFYDGCLLYNFNTDTVNLIDIDEYRKGPFILDINRLPGSKRFMAPEEFLKGSTIDHATNVFTMGRLAIELLGEGSISNWKGNKRTLEVVHKATSQKKSDRYQTIKEFTDTWRDAQSYKKKQD
ncbi:MAG: serine/threonine protein kinase [Candidatus Kariarchaeaceae archaeon]|jgi:serine/threonine-protein kinase